MKTAVRLLLLAVGALVLLAAGATIYVSRHTYRLMNPVLMSPPYSRDPASEALHRQLFVADLHADTFNFDTPFIEGHDYAQVDLPRIQAGGLSLMTFALATEIPFSSLAKNPAGNARGGNLVTLSAVTQLEPVANWFSNYQRGLYSLRRARQLVDAHPEQLMLIRYREDLEALLARKRRDPSDRMLGVLFSVEGAHILDGRLERLDALYAEGVRMLSLTHAFDNETGGSSEGVGKGGITAYGEAVLARMQALGIIPDLAHASPALVDDILARVDGPVVYSHGGIQGVCDIDRNLRDAALERIRDHGGLVAIGFWPRVLCGSSVDDITASLRYVADRIGVEHLALGSDFDGGVKTIFDVSGLPLLTASLRHGGFTDAEVRRIMGGNYARLLLRSLPRRTAADAGPR